MNLKIRNTMWRNVAARHDLCGAIACNFRLSVFDVDEDRSSPAHDIKEQDVYMVDMPLMTDNGTFINGTERVIVSQMHRWCVLRS